MNHRTIIALVASALIGVSACQNDEGGATERSLRDLPVSGAFFSRSPSVAVDQAMDKRRRQVDAASDCLVAQGFPGTEPDLGGIWMTPIDYLAQSPNDASEHGLGVRESINRLAEISDQASTEPGMAVDPTSAADAPYLEARTDCLNQAVYDSSSTSYAEIRPGLAALIDAYSADELLAAARQVWIDCAAQEFEGVASPVDLTLKYLESIQTRAAGSEPPSSSGNPYSTMMALAESSWDEEIRVASAIQECTESSLLPIAGHVYELEADLLEKFPTLAKLSDMAGLSAVQILFNPDAAIP